MFNYDVERFRVVISELTRKNIGEDAWNWMSNHLGKMQDLNLVFSLIPRKISRKKIDLNEHEFADLNDLRANINFRNWNSDRLARVCLLSFLPAENEKDYIKAVETLLQVADVEEQVAIYSALPLFAFPAYWKKQCAEGIRSNIGQVLEALMYNNPYPAEQLEDQAWNQLVLKAFFTEKDVSQIYGMRDRANQELALILSDYAHERWSAHRTVPKLLWPIVVNFPDDQILQDLEKVLNRGSAEEKEWVLMLLDNHHKPAVRALLTKFTEENNPN